MGILCPRHKSLILVYMRWQYNRQNMDPTENRKTRKQIVFEATQENNKNYLLTYLYYFQRSVYPPFFIKLL